MNWACLCAEHVLPLFGEKIDEHLLNALRIGKAWTYSKATVGDARKAAVLSHAIARESVNPVSIAVARAVGHAVATAHCADHSLGGAIYALKAVKFSGRSVFEERVWQNEHLEDEIKELILSARTVKEQGFRDLREFILL
ncbi:MAG: hypothetical protein NT007_11010 [Candidatus Kapabacteria bacterium]|nr:hypothetical protein [Candidatus Kapabacteria bacterium]